MGRKRILVSPLDWGLGHASRLVPIIRELIHNDAKVIIASHGKSASFLKIEFPELEHIELKGIHVSYPTDRKGMVLKMVRLASRFYVSIHKEHLRTKKIVRDYRIDGIISDNRYGVWSKSKPSILLTHQLFIKAPIGQKHIQKITQKFINRFSECWVPDYGSEDNLTGELSHQINIPGCVKYIGPLSRFTVNNSTDEKKYDVIAIVSGPEPQKTIFKTLVVNQLRTLRIKSIVICGDPEQNVRETDETVELVSHLSSTEMEEKIRQSKLVIARSGYSTIMDLLATNSRAFLVPTPGQTEQEYLAKMHMKQGNFFYMEQHEFNLKEAMNIIGNYDGLDGKKTDLYKKYVKSFLDKL